MAKSGGRKRRPQGCSLRSHRLRRLKPLTPTLSPATHSAMPSMLPCCTSDLKRRIDKIARGDIRVVAHANDVPSIRSKTTIVMITNREILRKRRDALARFLLAYRETVEWMYSDPAALQRYAELANVSKGIARELRDEFFPKEMLLPDSIIGLNAIVKDAIGQRYLQKGLSRGQIRNLVPVAPPTLVERVLCAFISAECPTELISP